MSIPKTEKKQSRGGKFLKDLGVYAIGNLGSKLITFLLIPFYTHFITDPSAYGYYDLCLTVICGFIPIISIGLGDGGFRFLLESDSDSGKREIISFIYKTLIRNSVFITLISLTVSLFVNIDYLFYIVLYGIIHTFYDVIIQLVRGLGKTKQFVAAGIINSFLVAFYSVIFVAILELSIEGIFIANILAKLTTLLILEVNVRIIHLYFKFLCHNKELEHNLLKYSLPLVPTAICWWFISGNNLFFLQHFTGLYATGIYGVVGRFTGILQIIAFIFYQTWQQNAIEQYNSPDRNVFFSKVFNNYFFFLSFLITIFPFALRLNYGWLVGPNYQEGANFLYLNSIYMMFHALSSFFELGYQCSKKTYRILPSLALTFTINVSANYILVQRWGINGIIISNILTFGALMVYRMIDTRKWMKISFNPANIFCSILVIAMCVAYYLSTGFLFDLICIAILIITFVIILPNDLRNQVNSRFCALLYHHSKVN